MADSFAALAYGVYAHSCDLVVAGSAYGSLSAPLHALDLIILRRRRGKLATSIGSRSWSTRSVVERVPKELWEMVRQALIDAEVVAVRLELMARFVCGPCLADQIEHDALVLARADGIAKADPPERYKNEAAGKIKRSQRAYQLKHAWDVDWISRQGDDQDGALWHDSLLGKYVHWALNQVVEGLHKQVSVRQLGHQVTFTVRDRADGRTPGHLSQSLTKLLATFGLYLPLKDTLTGSIESQPSVHTTPLALKVRDSKHRFVEPRSAIAVEPDEADWAMGQPGEVVDVPRAVFRVNKTADARFRRFLRAYHVHTENKSTKAPGEGQGQERDSTKRGDTPRWMLVQKLRCDPDMF